MFTDDIELSASWTDYDRLTIKASVEGDGADLRVTDQSGSRLSADTGEANYHKHTAGVLIEFGTVAEVEALVAVCKFLIGKMRHPQREAA